MTLQEIIASAEALHTDIDKFISSPDGQVRSQAATFAARAKLQFLHDARGAISQALGHLHSHKNAAEDAVKAPATEASAN